MSREAGRPGPDIRSLGAFFAASSLVETQEVRKQRVARRAIYLTENRLQILIAPNTYIFTVVYLHQIVLAKHP